MPLESVYLNGGFIGRTADFADTSKYILSSSQSTITYVGSAKSDNSTTIDLSGISMLPGDIVLVISGEDGGSPGTATGYTSLASVSSTGDVNVMYKIMPDPVDSSVTGLTAGGSDSGHLAVVFRGVDSTTPIDATTTTATNSAGDPNPPSITTVTNGAMVVALAFLDDDLVEGGVTAPSGYTLADSNQFGSSESGGTVMVVYKEVATAGSEDPGTIVTTGDDWWWAATVALRPGIDITYGNQKNTGIWNLQAVLETSVVRYIGYSTGYALDASQDTATLSYPVGSSVRDLAVVWLCTDDQASNKNIPSGWTLISYSRGADTNTRGFAIAKKLTESDISSPPELLTSSDTHAWICMTFRNGNFDTISPQDLTTNEKTTILSEIISSGSGTAPTIVFGMVGCKDNYTGGPSFGGNETDIVELNGLGTSHAQVAIAMKLFDRSPIDITRAAWTGATDDSSIEFYLNV